MGDVNSHQLFFSVSLWVSVPLSICSQPARISGLLHYLVFSRWATMPCCDNNRIPMNSTVMTALGGWQQYTVGWMATVQWWQCWVDDNSIVMTVLGGWQQYSDDGVGWTAQYSDDGVGWTATVQWWRCWVDGNSIVMTVLGGRRQYSDDGVGWTAQYSDDGVGWTATVQWWWCWVDDWSVDGWLDWWSLEFHWFKVLDPWMQLGLSACLLQAISWKRCWCREHSHAVTACSMHLQI